MISIGTRSFADSKANPGKTNYASTGFGSVTHLNMELLKSYVGVDIRKVSYKGHAHALPDMITGQVQMMMDLQGTTLPQVKSSKLKFIAVTNPQRSSVQPEVPTVAEEGLPNFDASTWYGVWAQAKTPRDVVARPSMEFVTVAQSQPIKERLAKLGMKSLTADLRKFGQIVLTEQARRIKTIKAANIKGE
jgi:tripartite-type tricarboxylate transporter receptor subunit TctC